MRSRLKLLAAVAGALLLVLAAVALLLTAGGVYERYSAVALRTPGGRRAAPAWTRECRNQKVGYIANACVHLKGRVVWVQHHDSDGDGDRHLIVVVRLHAHLVKLTRRFHLPVPGIGRAVSATGYDVTGASGHDEIDADRVSVGGKTYRKRL